MTDMATIQIVSLVAWLALMLTAYGSYHFNWKHTVKLVLVWASIIAGLTLVISFLGG